VTPEPADGKSGFHLAAVRSRAVSGHALDLGSEVDVKDQVWLCARRPAPGLAALLLTMAPRCRRFWNIGIPAFLGMTLLTLTLHGILQLQNLNCSDILLTNATADSDWKNEPGKGGKNTMDAEGMYNTCGSPPPQP
jgi:hypothetical protein